MILMQGWLREPAAFASRTKRSAARSKLEAAFLVMVLMATFRPIWVSNPSNTSPAEPNPIFRTMRYFPTRTSPPLASLSMSPPCDESPAERTGPLADLGGDAVCLAGMRSMTSSGGRGGMRGSECRAPPGRCSGKEDSFPPRLSWGGRRRGCGGAKAPAGTADDCAAIPILGPPPWEAVGWAGAGRAMGGDIREWSAPGDG